MASSNFTSLTQAMISAERMDPIPSMYFLHELIASVSSDDTATVTEDHVTDYVRGILPDGDGVTVRSRKPLKVVQQSVRPLAIASPVIPDGSVLTGVGEYTLLVWEVESQCNWEYTKKKLAIALALILVGLRNCHPNNGAMKVIGFYFPKTKKECVVEITLEWSDSRLQFLEEDRYLNMDEVDSSLTRAYQHNHRLWRLQRSHRDRSALCYPLSTAFLQQHHLKQLESGQSIVLLNEQNKKVYKYHVDPLYQTRVRELYFRHQLLHFRGIHTQRIAFPEAIQILDGSECNFSVCQMYDPPLKPDKAKIHIVWFVREVVKAVSELHELDIAHLDIRLENICIDHDHCRVMLIDLDRSREASSRKDVHEVYGHHEMYLKERGWTLAKLDWKQVGLMMQLIFATDSSRNPEFVEKLINEGT